MDGAAFASAGAFPSPGVFASPGGEGAGRAVRFAVHKGPRYSLFACYAFTINYLLGVGSLGLPYAVKQAGSVASVLMIVAVSLLSFVTALMVARTALRAELLNLSPCDANPWGKWCYVMCIATKGEPRLHQGSMCDKCEHNCSRPPQCFEVVQLCEQFLGRAGKLCYQIALMVLMYCGLLAYVLVFVATISLFGPSRDLSLLICAMVMIPLSFLNVTEMVPLQVALSLTSIVTLLVMGCISMGSIVSDPGSLHPLAPVNVTGLGLAFSVALFSQLFQHSVPGLIHPLTHEDRGRVPRTFALALVTTAAIYCFFGLSCALVFGDGLEQAVNTNFASFDWGARPPWIAKTTSLLCAFYPALGTVAVFPLIAITLGNNLCVMAPVSETCLAQHPRKVTMLFRFLAAAPPIALALPLQNLSMVFKLAGLAGIWVAFVTPALLQMCSRRVVVHYFERLNALAPRGFNRAVTPDGDAECLAPNTDAECLSAEGKSWSRLSSPESARNWSRQTTETGMLEQARPLLRRQPTLARPNPLYPMFNHVHWVKLVLGAAVVAFLVTTAEIANDIWGG